jgi:Fe-S-cluster containining protein
MKIKQDLGGFAWSCRMCGGCCDTPQITKKDIANIAGHLRLSFKEVVDKYLSSFDGVYGEMKSVKGKCIFLKENRCSIYKVRPLICRLRPYSPQMKNGKLILTYDIWFKENCKGIYKGELPVEEEYLKYGELVVKYMGVEEPEK